MIAAASTSPATILVTGSGGFIGRHLVRSLLTDGFQVWGVDLRSSGITHERFVERLVDLRERERLQDVVQEAAPGALVHLAARTDLNETRDLNGYNSNIVGVENLVSAVGATPSIVRWICTSTQLVCRIGYTPNDEHDYQPSTLYGESKVQTERIVRAAAGAEREWCLVRPTTIWGPWMNPHYLTYFRMIRKGTYFHVGRGPTFKSYGYVGNTVYQLRRLLGAPVEQIQARVFYLADYEPMALEDWANAFQRALGAPPIRTIPLSLARAASIAGDVINRLGMPRFPFNSFRLGNVLTPYQVDMTATANVCGPLPFTMDDGVRATTEWLRELWGSEQNAAPRDTAKSSR